MARQHLVKSARKAQGNCRACRKEIQAGDSYKWAKPRYGGKVVVCAGCQITPSMVSSSKMVAIWEAQELFDASGSISDIAENLRVFAGTVRDVGQEYQDACDNQREYFPDSELAQENEDKAQELESWADELEGKANEIEELQTEIDGLEAEREDAETTSDRQEEIDSEIEQKKEEAQDMATEAIAECPV